jgi:hypothetical protein
MQGFMASGITLPKVALAAMCAGFLLSGAVHATPIETFNLDHPAAGSGIPAGTWGTVTLSLIDLNEVEVDLLLAPGVLLVNTGGSAHTPFAFNISGAQPASGIVVLHPSGAAECLPATILPCFTPTYAAENAAPYGTLSQGIAYSGGNGGANHGNDGPLNFTITLPGIGHMTNGLFDRFVANGQNAIFAADLYVPSNTGSSNTGEVAATAGTAGDNPVIIGTQVPEPLTLTVLGVAFAGLGAARKRRRI